MPTTPPAPCRLHGLSAACVSTLCLLFSPLALAAAEYDPLQRTGVADARPLDLTVHDEKRQRDIPIRVHLPSATMPEPMVMFSHGTEGSRETKAFLGAHWSAGGYAGVFLQHPGSDVDLWKPLPREQRMAAMETGLVSRTTTWQGSLRTWTAYVPAAAATDPTRIRRLVICLHGYGGTGAAMRAMIQQGFDALCEADDVIVAYPDGLAGAWNDDRPWPAAIAAVDDVGFLAALADQCAQEWRADPRSIVLIGFSNGGGMSRRLARELNARTAALITVASAAPTATMLQGLPGPVPMMAISATGDPIAVYAGQTYNVGTPLEYTTVPIESMISSYVTWNGSQTPPAFTAVADTTTTDSSTAGVYHYAAAGPGTAPVQFWKITGGGHTWPSGLYYDTVANIGYVCKDFNGCQATWDFMKSHAKALDAAPVITAGASTTLTVLEDAAGSLSLTASDADGDTMNWSVQTQGTKGTATASGTGASINVSYTPAANQNGGDSFILQVADGRGGIDSIMVAVTITAVHDAPVVAVPIPDQIAVAGEAFSYQLPAGSFIDVDGDALVWSSDESLGWLAFDAATRTFSGIPGTGDIAVTTITVTAGDGSLSASDAFALTVASASGSGSQASGGSGGGGCGIGGGAVGLVLIGLLPLRRRRCTQRA